MCGIFGVVGVPERLIGIGKRTLAHRGPDDYGFLVWDGRTDPILGDAQRLLASARHPWVQLEHLRLSILDLSKAGWQPMTTTDGRYYLVYNGEVYNYRELRQELERAGVRFQSQTDTEVVLQAFAFWGPQALTRFVGMFAFAILDVQGRELFLVRDFFGIKPLYYTPYRQGLAFSSEIKALLALPGKQAIANPQRVYDYLRYGLTDHTAETLFREVYQVPPGHYLRVPFERPQAFQLVRYWSPWPEETLDLSMEEAAARLRTLFLESVQLHLRSDVPVGTALSGGIDSSSIVSAIRYIAPEAEIHTFSFIPQNDETVNEERWVDIVGRHVRAIMHKTHPDPKELPHDLEDLVVAQDEPFGGTSIYAQYRVFRLARENGIKVMLDGQGADELLAGYSAYYVSRALSLWRKGRYGELLRFLMRIRNIPAARGWTYILSRWAAAVLPPKWQHVPRRWMREELIPPWMNTAWFHRHGVRPVSLWQFAHRDALRAHLVRDLSTVSLPHLLRYEDRNSMWHSIESRVPFLTPQLVRFVFALPETYLIAPDGTTKAVFRNAMRGIVPPSILERRDKIGFATPERAWLAALRPWVERVLTSETARAIPALRLEVMREVWRQQKLASRVHWRWINLIQWTAHFNVTYG